MAEGIILAGVSRCTRESINLAKAMVTHGIKLIIRSISTTFRSGLEKTKEDTNNTVSPSCFTCSAKALIARVVI